MFDQNNPEIKFALNAVRQAALLVRQVQQELVTPAITKQDHSPVTVADFASQALIGYLLAKAFSQDPLVAEEDSSALRQPASALDLDLVTGFVRRFTETASPQDVCTWIDYGNAETGKRFWTLDPIDGTKGFLRGDQYAVALALVVDGQVQIGVLGCPNLTIGDKNGAESPGSLTIAVRNQGAWTSSLAAQGEFNRLHVSVQAQPSQARIMRSFESGHTNVSQIDIFAQTLGVQVAPVRLDSQAKYALLAAGESELYLRLLSPAKSDYREKIWDQAAGSLVLAEAGGRITDLDGEALDFTTGRTLRHNRGILASNSELHNAALEALRAINA
jgi:3'(2'), 5'-bisphosphate nucleotidase